MPALFLCLIGVGACSNANAECVYAGTESGAGELTLMWFSTLLLDQRMWFEDAKNPYPNGTLLLLKNVSVNVGACRSGTFPAEFKGETLRLVYVAPSTATAIGNRFRIPTLSPGVAFEIEFPGKGAYSEPNSIDVGLTKGPVVPNGGLTRGIELFTLRLSLVKTGPFSTAPTHPEGSMHVLGSIRLDAEQLGSFRYYSEDGTKLVPKEDKIIFPEQKIVANHPSWVAYAGAPACVFNSFPLTPANISMATMKLADVSQQKFKAVGAIEDGGKTQNMTFDCWGLLSTKPVVTFEATYPLTGAVGVGMPSASSDVGVQIFLNDQPVALGKALGIDITMNSLRQPSSTNFPMAPVSGHFCQADCGEDMDGANWKDGRSGFGNVTAPFRFKYYQTTSKRPAVQQLVVPFSITIDVQ